MKIKLRAYDDYKTFLAAVVKEEKRGFITRLAEAAGCQRSYLSNVIRSHIHLVPDQAYGICRYLSLDAADTAYFLLLLERDRASTQAYRKHLEAKIEKLQKERENLAQRLERSSLPREADQLSYYSAWYYAAIHIGVSAPKLQTVAALSSSLGLDHGTVQAVLEELAAMGLVKRSGARWVFLSGDIHVAKDSPLVSLHHGNWRQRAVLNSQRRKDGVHFTMVQTMSASVARALREKVLMLIDEASAMAGPSAAEELVYFGVDEFRIS